MWEDSTWVAKAQKVMVWGASFSELLSYHRWNGESWDSYMVTQDEQGSVTRLHDADGNEVERVEYDPYGARTVYVPAGGGSYTAMAQSSVGLEVGYTGHRHDPETGLIYARNRYLHTEWGRFMTVDPIGSWADSANLGNPYAYVGNNPASAADPSGKLSLFGTGAGGRGDAYLGGGGGFGGFGFDNISGMGTGGALSGGPPTGPDPDLIYSGSGATISTPGDAQASGTCTQEDPQLTLCEVLARELDKLANEALDWGDFLEAAENSCGYGERYNLGHALYDKNRKSDNPLPLGFADEVAANARDNMAHYLSGHAFGQIALVAQYHIDLLELLTEGDEEKEQNRAEIAADCYTGAALTMLVIKLNLEDSNRFWPIASDDTAWSASKHLVGGLWREFFCKRRDQSRG
ncbi:MAG: RHS repeat-associated core domain-containing protein [Planctomycetes bacterium]|nr:RHS repeat-associated core domain-containing protein [Planctomycetota bacterium]